MKRFVLIAVMALFPVMMYSQVTLPDSVKATDTPRQGMSTLNYNDKVLRDSLNAILAQMPSVWSTFAAQTILNMGNTAWLNRHSDSLRILYDSLVVIRQQLNIALSDTGTGYVDNVPPTTIANLVVSGGTESVTMDFTSPNANPGDVTSYDIRYSNKTITEFGDSTNTSSSPSCTFLGSGRTDATSTLSVAVTVPSGSNTELVVTTGGYSWSPWFIDSIKIADGTHLTKRVEGEKFDHQSHIWTLSSPPAGTYAITAYVSGASAYYSMGAYFVSSAGAYRIAVSNLGTDASVSYVDVPTSVDNELIIDSHSGDPDVTLITWGGGQTEGYSYIADGSYDATGSSSYRLGTSGTVTMQLTYNAPLEDFVACAIVISSGTTSTVSTAWASATQYVGEPTPKSNGSSESFVLNGIPVGTYYFAVKSVDANGNISALSNVDSAISSSSGYTNPVIAGWNGGYGYAYVDSVITSPSSPNAIWVDSAAAAGGDGSYAFPYRTISSGVTAAGSGDTVFVMGGTYPESITLKSNITITAYARERVKVTGNSSGKLYFMTGSSVSNSTVQGIEFVTARIYHDVVDPNYYRIDLPTPVNVNINYCSVIQSLEDITNASFGSKNEPRAMTSHQPEHLTITGCYFYGWSHSLVVDINTTDTTFLWVKFNHFALQGWCAMILGYTSYLAPIQQQGVLIENNLFENTYGEDGIQWQPYFGTARQQFDMKHYGHLVRKNVFRDCGENAVDFKATGGIRVEDNYFYRITGVDDGFYNALAENHSGGAFALGANESSQSAVVRGNVSYSNPGTFEMIYPYWKVYNNTEVNNMRFVSNGVSTDRINNCSDVAHWGYWLTYDDVLLGDAGRRIRGNALKNNASVNNYIYIQTSANDANLDIDYNCYYQTTGTPLFSYHNGSVWQSVSGLSEWVSHFNASVLGRDAHSFSLAPLFTNVPNYPTANHNTYDFTPQAGSPLVGAAGPLTVATNSGSSVTSLTVYDAAYFRTDLGMGSMGVTTDSIKIGAGSPVGITSINYSTNTIVINSPRSWSVSDGVYLHTNGKTWDDIGAIQR